MHIDKKYFTAFTSDIGIEQPQKFYIDWYYRKPNLKLYYKDSHEFIFEIGLAGKRLSISVKWCYRSRLMNEREKERKERIDEFLSQVEDSNE
jgi:hypothetical protein